MDPLETQIEIYDWPHRFFVQGDWKYPNLVDLEDQECDCADYQNIQRNQEPRQCIHLILATEYRNKIKTCPKRLPELTL